MSEDNPIRAADAFVDGLDLKALGYTGVSPVRQGVPVIILRPYLWYLNGIPSSRRLERECGRNLELIWLTGNLAPDFKTIADFRKDDGEPLRQTCSLREAPIA